jgi:hypothetical protein
MKRRTLTPARQMGDINPGEIVMKPNVAASLLLVAGLLFLGAAVFPLTRGGSVNVAFLLLAGALIVLAPVARARMRSTESTRT